MLSFFFMASVKSMASTMFREAKASTSRVIFSGVAMSLILLRSPMGKKGLLLLLSPPPPLPLAMALVSRVRAASIAEVFTSAFTTPARSVEKGRQD
jgi:hypothetical protein